MNLLPPPTHDLGFPDITRALIRKKWFLAGSALLFACITLGYTSFIGPTYRASSVVAMATPVNLHSYNIGIQTAGQAIDEIMLTANPKSEWMQMTPLKDLTPKEAYAIFLRHLNSTHNKAKFFDEFYVPIHEQNFTSLPPQERENLWQRFNRSLKIAMPHKDTPDAPVTLSLTGENAVQTASLLNKYTALALTSSQHELQQTLSQDIGSRLTVIDQQIQAMRTTAAVVKQARIVQLRDALELARQINLEQPAQQGNIITSFTGDTMYLRGSKALEAELHQVQARQDNDPYIIELETVIRRRNMLETVDTRAIKLQTALIDQSATVPQRPLVSSYLMAFWGALAGLFIAAAFSIVGLYVRHARG